MTASLGSRPLRVAVLVGEFPALSETFVLDHVRTLAASGAEVTVIAQRPRQDEPSSGLAAVAGVRLCYLGMPRGRWRRALAAPLRLARISRLRLPVVASSLDALRYGRTALSLDLFYSASASLPSPADFDILHCHFGDCALRGVFLRDHGLLSARRLVATLHGAEDRIGERALKRLFAGADLLLPVSRLWGRQMEVRGCPPQKLRVHHLGIDCARFARPPASFRRDRPLRIITVCRLAEKKGISDSLAALARLRQRRPKLDFLFEIVGDGPLRTRLEAEGRALSLADRLLFRGAAPRAEVPRLLAEADIFLHPSVTDRHGEREGIPVSIMEAMAAGLPVVTTRHGGIPELVEQEVSGVLVAEHDVEGLAEALLELAEAPELRRRLGEAGCRRVEQDFNRLAQDRLLLDLYESLLAEPPAGKRAASAAALRGMEVL